jgi:hypothetical protein
LSDDDVFEWIESKEEIDLIQYWTIVQGLMQNYEVKQDWISETFNIPIVGKKQLSQSEIIAQLKSGKKMAMLMPILEAVSKLKEYEVHDTEQKDNDTTNKPWKRDYLS